MKKITIWLCTLLLLFSVIAPGVTARAASTTTQTKTVTREIAVVFDNSGSMFGQFNTRWCAATYAVEVFAAMMNAGDVLKVFPMWSVESDGRTYSDTDPIVVRDVGDIDLVHNMFTGYANGTPARTIRNAYADLSRSKADERWLLILTDGDMWDIGLPTALQPDLDEYSRDVKVQYLSIGTNSFLTEGPNLFVDYCGISSDEILDSVTQVCNTIFGRDLLPASCIRGQEISFDVSMKKLIVLSQGEGAQVNDLSDSGGKTVPELSGSRYDARYSEAYTHIPGVAQTDTSLMGTIVTYTDLPAGTYDLDYVGELCVYYEPDVSIQVTITDSDHQLVDGSDPDTVMHPGNYTFDFCLIDNMTGKPTQSNLLGNIHFDASYTLNGNTVSFESGETVNLAEEGDFSFQITAEYLNDYTVTYTDDDYFQFGQLDDGIIPRAPDEFVITITGPDTVSIATFNDEAHFTLTYTYGGEKLPADVLQEIADQFQMTVPKGFSYSIDSVDEAGSSLKLSLYIDGTVGDESVGPKTMTVTQTYQPQGFDPATATAAHDFTITSSVPDMEMKIRIQDNFFLANDLENGQPFLLEITKNGGPLTDEELNELLKTLEIQLTGAVTYEAKALPGESTVEVRLKYLPGQDTVIPGNFDLEATMTARDDLGNPVEFGAKKGFTVSTMPRWLQILLGILALLVLLAIIWSILSIKVLPKRITHKNGNLQIGAKSYQEPPRLKYNRSGKSVSATTPTLAAYPTMPEIKITVRMIPDSPLRKPSKDRAARIRDISIVDDPGLKSIRIGKNAYERNLKTGELERTNKGDFGMIKNGTACECLGKFDGRSFFYSFQFKFTNK